MLGLRRRPFLEKDAKDKGSTHIFLVFHLNTANLAERHESESAKERSSDEKSDISGFGPNSGDT